MDDFIHVQVRSEYSLLTSTCRIDELIDQAASLGFSALALTDRNVMYGTHKFFERCKQKGIKPLLGLELDVQFQNGTTGLFLLQAINLKGYQQLLRLSSHAQSTPASGVQADFFYQHCSDVMIILPEKTSFLAHVLQKEGREAAREAVRELKEKLGDEERLYAGCLPPYVLEDAEHRDWVTFIEDVNIKRVACGNVAFLKEEDEKWRRCLEAIRSNRPIEKVSPLEWQEENHLFSKSFASEAWAKDEKARLNTVDIARRCTVDLHQLKTTLPSFEENAKDKLRSLCFQGATERYGKMTDEVAQRLHHELGVISKIGFEDYFLIVWDFMDYARKAGILTGPGRGSAAGSIVAYCLYITDVDPLAFGLLFERFLNESRSSSLPDIDIDFPDHRREEIISYVRNKYGSQHVGQIITFGTFGGRAALRDAGKALGTPQKLLERILRMLPPSSQFSSLTEYRKKDEKLLELLGENDLAYTLFQYAEAIEGLPRHTSLHAAGVVFSKKPISELIPTVQGQLTEVTQFPMGDLEAYGLLKIDFLGLRNLTLLEHLRDRIKDKYNVNVNPKFIPIKDPKTFRMLAAGETTGIFQFESTGMQQVLKKLQPTTFEDLVAVNALYRPGPMRQIDVYIDGKHGRRMIQYVHPDLKPILSSTYGVMVYQEQIMQVAAQIAGYSLSQADLLRRAVSKKDRAELEKEKSTFIAGALKNGYHQATAEQIYSWILRFAEYGFNRSHAVAYSFIAYQLAYVKAHYPLVFFSAYMNMVENDNERLNRAMREIKQQDFKMYPPSINKSTDHFGIEENGLRFPLQIIAGVGRQMTKQIIKERKIEAFTSFIQFCERTAHLSIHHRMLTNLVKAGTFDELHSDRAMLLASIDRALEFVDFHKDLGQLFQQGTGDFRYADATPLRLEERYSFEKEVTNFYMSGHPLDQYTDIINMRDALAIVDVESAPVNQHIWIIGFIDYVKQIRTKNGQTMAFLQLSDESAVCEVVLFPDVYRKVNPLLQEHYYAFVCGKRTVDQYGNKVIAETLHPVERAQEDAKTALYIKLEDTSDTAVQVRKLKGMLQKQPGFSQVRVFNETKQRLYALDDHYRVHINDELRANLKRFFGEENVAEQAI